MDRYTIDDIIRANILELHNKLKITIGLDLEPEDINYSFGGREEKLYIAKNIIPSLRDEDIRAMEEDDGVEIWDSLTS